MLEELKEAYDAIDLEDKRNELNKEILSLLMLTDIDSKFYNYNKGSKISEDKYLTETYIQIIKLKENVVKMLKQNNKLN